MKVYGYTINNKTYEGTVAITRDDFEDDNLGVYTPLFQEMGRAAAAQPDELVFTALRDGNKTDCYDGKHFFDSEHPVYPKVDGTGDATKQGRRQRRSRHAGTHHPRRSCGDTLGPGIDAGSDGEGIFDR